VVKVFGFLVDWISSNYQLSIWSGVHRFCLAHEVNLVTLVSGRGGSRERWDWVRAELGKSISTRRFDGFLVMTSTLLTTLGPDLEKQLRELTGPGPVVSLGEPLEGCPTIRVDNHRGFRRLLEHLLGHGHRRFAYAGGPLTNRDARERRDLLVAFLKEHDLAVRPDRILEGEFSTAWGMEAVSRLVPGAEPDFDVLVCANDDIAMGALEAFALKNLQIPGDVALTGFDDVQSSGQTGLTTARQPLADLGWRAAELLWERVEGRTVPELTRMDTEMVVRQTCGCLSLAAQLVQAEPEGAPTSSEQLLEEMTREGLPPEHCSTLEEVFLTDWRSDESSDFLHSLRHLLSDMHRSGLPPGLLHYPLSVLRRWALRGAVSARDRDFAETAVHQARILLSEVVHTRSVQEGTHQLLIKDLLNDLNQRLTNSRDLAEQADVLRNLLPKLGVPRFWLSLHDAPPVKAEPAVEPWATVGEALLDRDGLIGTFVLEVGGQPRSAFGVQSAVRAHRTRSGHHPAHPEPRGNRRAPHRRARPRPQDRRGDQPPPQGLGPEGRTDGSVQPAGLCDPGRAPAQGAGAQDASADAVLR
jgi:DNA-binding LacI/PurR family transcriptional regulator